MTERRDDATGTGDSGEMAALRAAIDRLEARLARLEARDAAPSPVSELQRRVKAAWRALTGRDSDAPDGGGDASTGTAPGDRSRLLTNVLVIAAGLAALVLAVELIRELFRGLRHFLHWIF